MGIIIFDLLKIMVGNKFGLNRDRIEEVFEIIKEIQLKIIGANYFSKQNILSDFEMSEILYELHIEKIMAQIEWMHAYSTLPKETVLKNKKFIQNLNNMKNDPLDFFTLKIDKKKPKDLNRIFETLSQNELSIIMLESDAKKVFFSFYLLL